MIIKAILCQLNKYRTLLLLRILTTTDRKIWLTLSKHPNLTAYLFIRPFSMKYISTHDFTYKTTNFIKISFMEGRVLAILINNYYLIIHELYNKYLHFGCAAENAIQWCNIGNKVFHLWWIEFCGNQNFRNHICWLWRMK